MKYRISVTIDNDFDNDPMTAAQLAEYIANDIKYHRERRASGASKHTPRDYVSFPGVGFTLAADPNVTVEEVTEAAAPPWVYDERHDFERSEHDPGICTWCGNGRNATIHG